MIGDLEMGEILSLDQTGTKYKRNSIDMPTFTKVKQQAIEPGDLLFSIKATIGKVSLVQEVPDAQSRSKLIVANQNMLILRLKERAPISALALLCYLSNPVITKVL